MVQPQFDGAPVAHLLSIAHRNEKQTQKQEAKKKILSKH